MNMIFEKKGGNLGTNVDDTIAH